MYLAIEVLCFAILYFGSVLWSDELARISETMKSETTAATFHEKADEGNPMTEYASSRLGRQKDRLDEKLSTQRATPLVFKVFGQVFTYRLIR
jgi:hypothetical protein